MLKVLGSLIPFASLSIGTISLAAPVTQPPVSNQSPNPKNSSPVNVKSAQQPSPSLPSPSLPSPSLPSPSLPSSNSSESLPNLVQPKQVCGAQDLSFLEQGLAPRSAELQALPQTDALAVPQQPPAVAIQQTLSLELPAAVRYAFDRNPDLQVTKLQLQRSCEQLKQVKAANYPTLSLASSFSRTDGGSFRPRNRVYGTNSGDQQQIQQQIQQEQSTAQQELQQQISTLQTRFQQTSTQVQTNTLQQQITQLQQRVSLTVLSDPVDVTPLTPSAVSLPLRSGTSSGGVGGYFNSI
jgi:Outer membrane efflux protein